MILIQKDTDRKKDCVKHNAKKNNKYKLGRVRRRTSILDLFKSEYVEVHFVSFIIGKLKKYLIH